MYNVILFDLGPVEKCTKIDSLLRYGRATLSDRSEQAPRSLQFGGEALSPSHLNGYRFYKNVLTLAASRTYDGKIPMSMTPAAAINNATTKELG